MKCTSPIFEPYSLYTRPLIRTSMEHLPLDVVLKIAVQLDYADLQHWSCTGKEMAILNSQIFWERLIAIVRPDKLDVSVQKPVRQLRSVYRQFTGYQVWLEFGDELTVTDLLLPDANALDAACAAIQVLYFIDPNLHHSLCNIVTVNRDERSTHKPVSEHVDSREGVALVAGSLNSMGIRAFLIKLDNEDQSEDTRNLFDLLVLPVDEQWMRWFLYMLTWLCLSYISKTCNCPSIKISTLDVDVPQSLMLYRSWAADSYMQISNWFTSTSVKKMDSTGKTYLEYHARELLDYKFKVHLPKIKRGRELKLTHVVGDLYTCNTYSLAVTVKLGISETAIGVVNGDVRQILFDMRGASDADKLEAINQIMRPLTTEDRAMALNLGMLVA